jgi:hypothetical protein
MTSGLTPSLMPDSPQHELRPAAGGPGEGSVSQARPARSPALERSRDAREE